MKNKNTKLEFLNCLSGLGRGMKELLQFIKKTSSKGFWEINKVEGFNRVGRMPETACRGLDGPLDME